MGKFSSFLKGIGHILNFFGPSIDDYDFLQRPTETPEEADTRALQSDWDTVGKDMQTAIDKFEKELEEDDHK